MSALAVYLEQEGIATTIIGLVRLHLEKVRPPRALWVPFELGRPLGPPNNPDFQTRVLRAALRLLVAGPGPVLLEDFDQDQPGIEGDDNWRAPELRADSLADEARQLQSAYNAARSRFGRTTVGISGLSIDNAAEYMMRFDGADPLPSAHPDMSPLALMRFASDDIKAYYLEAASAAGRPGSRQLLDWFWNRTLAGTRVRELREFCLRSDERKYQAMADSLVPRAWR